MTAETSSLPNPKTGRSRYFWRLQCCAWSATALLTFFFGSQLYLTIEGAVVVGVFRAFYGFGVTSLLRLLYKRIKPGAQNIWLQSAGLILLCGIVALVDSVLSGYVGELFGVHVKNEDVRAYLVGSIALRWSLYLMWSLLYFGINFWLDTQDERLRLSQAEIAARDAELGLLRAQINPHFLFNALNSIQAEAGNAPVVLALTQALAEYLRFSLKQPTEFQPIGQELEALENYLRVEKIRFEERLEYKITASEEARRTPAPPALIQPLLENAIKYGQQTSPRPLRISIEVERAGNILRIAVCNSGKWVTAPANPSSQIGLANIRRRLHLLFGDTATLTTGAENGLVTMRLQLPLS